MNYDQRRAARPSHKKKLRAALDSVHEKVQQLPFSAIKQDLGWMEQWLTIDECYTVVEHKIKKRVKAEARRMKRKGLKKRSGFAGGYNA